MKIEIVAGAPSGVDLARFHRQGTFRQAGVKPVEFSGKKLTRLMLREGSRRVLHVGLGEGTGVATNLLRQAAGLAVKTLLKAGAEEVALELGPHAAEAQAFVEGALLGAYKFEEFRLPSDRRPNALKRLLLVAARPELGPIRPLAQRGRILAEATNYVREIGNQPGNVVTPADLARRARALAATWKMTCRVWDESALRREGFGGIVAVGQGSVNPPRLIVLEYRGGRRGAPPVALVGKAITFDSGGLSIKPWDRMDEMKFDKMGGCAVLGILRAAAELKLPCNLVGIIASAENMPSANAYRPGDLIRTWDGKVIEVLNTDAEGRVVLSDALGYAVKTYQPSLLIDMATLTGACVVALGASRAGLFTENESLRRRFWELGTRTGDLVWPLPMAEEFEEQIKSEIAVVKNSAGREGAACTAATFLRHWVGKTPWIHLDIAGPAWITKERPHLEPGATGFGVRLITEYLREQKGH